MKEFTIEFLIEGKLVGSSALVANGKTLMTDAAEDEFYAVLRKNEKRLLEQAEGEEFSHIIDNLTAAQEEKLQMAHMDAEPMTLDDDLPDAYENWVSNITLEELKAILETNA